MPHYVEKTVENGHVDRPKKKRWSFGGLFKRKSKKESDTSSDEEEGKGFLRRKKQTGSKDVTGSFVVQGVGRRVGGSTGSLDVQNRKTAKAKVEASREALESSSGDEGSYSSSLASGGGSLNRKSRAARTERYLRRKCEQWSPSPTRKPQGLDQRSGSEQGLAKRIRAPLYIPPPPPVRPPVVSMRSISDQYLSPPPIPHRKPVPSLTNSELSITSTRSDASNYRDYSHSLTPERVDIKKPPTPPERRSSRHSMVFPEPLDGKKRNSSNLEQALNELEAIYNSLRLGDDETDKNLPYRANSKTGMDSNFSSSQNSLSKRRPEKSDDMAYRRWNKRNQNVSDTREIMSQAGSYLLLSPTMSPPYSFPREPNEPHVTLDDVVYRNINHTNNTLRISDPQPPFGIPLGPVTPAPQSDYLHVSPSQCSRDLFESKRIPDVVLDDLAFRNLRKDAQDSTVNIKKKKATRSLSANLAHILIPNDKTHPVRGNYYEVNNNLDEYRSPSYSDIPKDLRLAQRILDTRLMNLRNKIKDQERVKINSSSETLHNSNRSNSGTPERRTPTREPQRARFGSDGQFKYSDLHPRTPPERRIVFREEWRRSATPEKKPVCKEELRKKFFADAYKNMDKNNRHHVWSKPAQKLTENPHHKIHFPHSRNNDAARMKPPRAEIGRTVANSSQQPKDFPRRSPVPHKTLTGEYFFPEDFEVPKSRRSPAVDELYVSYTARNRVPSPQRRVPSPHPGTPPSSPARNKRSSHIPIPENKDIRDVTVEAEDKIDPILSNGDCSRAIKKSELDPVKIKETSRGTDSDSGRATPSGEEVRRILCPEDSENRRKTHEQKEEEREREEEELLKKLEEEATATGLEMDRELMSLTVALPKNKLDVSQSSEVSSKRVADLLRELTRSLDYDFGPDDGNAGTSCRQIVDSSDKSVQRDVGSGSLLLLAYCMAVAQQLTSVDALSLFALFLAVISVFLFVYF